MKKNIYCFKGGNEKKLSVIVSFHKLFVHLRIGPNEPVLIHFNSSSPNTIEKHLNISHVQIHSNLTNCRVRPTVIRRAYFRRSDVAP